MRIHIFNSLYSLSKYLIMMIHFNNLISLFMIMLCQYLSPNVFSYSFNSNVNIKQIVANKPFTIEKTQHQYQTTTRKPNLSNNFNKPIFPKQTESYDSNTKSSPTFIREAVRNVGPSVVRIDCEREITTILSVLTPDMNMKEGDFVRISGSGFVTTDDGYILTNAHVVDKARKITITFSNGRTFKANMVACDELTDLAVLKVDFSGSHIKLKKAPLGDSSKLQSGDWLIAVGCPAGLDFTVTLGMSILY